MVTSVAEIQGRIDELSADIARQKQHLKTLERSKSMLQRQLNAARDPLARLPLEILSEIFIQCLPSRPAPGAHHPPLLFMNICNTWTGIALATAELWSSIHVDKPLLDLNSLLDVWMKRAGSRTLSISLPHTLPDEIHTVIERHAPQLHDLKMYHDDEDISSVLAAGPFPSLKTLTMVGVDTEEFLSSTAATRNMLRACPDLVECTWTMCITEVTAPTQRKSWFFHPCSISSSECFRQTAATRSWDTFPCLVCRASSFPSQPSKSHDFSAISEAFLPPLQSITVGDEGFVKWTLQEMEECLSLIPTLIHFELFETRVDTTPNLFLAILASSSHLLPKSLQYHLSVVRPTVGTLVSETIQRTLGPPRAPEDVCSQLRQLVADGMKIHIGTKDRNYV
ncbi:hypothetical protein B0H17DRAFT_1096182 [Mycena rosella]|uniref:F-box domain-containing protein n=1 Tax=Mycena rosella TaxID=1033263 RepID=A0AAD7CQZ9_MYCRO|nr:hypothetical protein B0H17DRAFT_1096182 [Mycena rosella]